MQSKKRAWETLQAVVAQKKSVEFGGRRDGWRRRRNRKRKRKRKREKERKKSRIGIVKNNKLIL